MNNLMKTMLDTVKQSGLVVFSHDVDSKPSVLTRSFMNVLLHASDMKITQLYKESQELFSSHGNTVSCTVDISLLTQPEHQKRKLRAIFRPDPDLVYLENISHNEERNLLLHLTATGHAVVAAQEGNSAKDTFLSFAESADSGFLEYLLSNGLFVHQRLNSDNPSRVEYDVLEITPDLIKSV